MSKIAQGTRDLNPQPSVLETDALPVELVPFRRRPGMPKHCLATPNEESTGPRQPKSNRPADTASLSPPTLWNDGSVSSSTPPLAQQSPDELAAFLAAQQSA